MNKILLILKREYTTRVQKKSFIILTLLMPVIMAALMFLPAYFMSMNDEQQRTIAVYDGSSVFLGRLESSNLTAYKFIPKDEYIALKKDIKQSSYYALLVIEPNFLTTKTVQIASGSNIPWDLKSQIQNKIQSILEKDKMAEVVRQTAIPDLEKKIESTKTPIKLETIKVGSNGDSQKSSTEIGMILGYIFGFMIYMFIFLYGTMVNARRYGGEAKSNR